MFTEVFYMSVVESRGCVAKGYLKWREKVQDQTMQNLHLSSSLNVEQHCQLYTETNFWTVTCKL